MTTIVCDSYKSAVKHCKWFNVSTKYIVKNGGGWLVKYPADCETFEEMA